MEQETTTDPRVIEVVRPHEGRMIAGVAEGLSNRLDIPGWILRVGFVITAFMGGLGLVAYLACWALIRDEADHEAPASRFFARASTPQAWLGVGLIVTAIMVFLMTVADRWTFAPASPAVLWGGLILLVGVLLYSGQLRLPISGEKPQPTDQSANQPMPNATSAFQASSAPVAPSPEPAPVAPPRSPKPPRAPKPPRQSSPLGRITIGVAILALGVLAALDAAGLTWFQPEVRHYLGLATVAVGGGLLVGSLWGRARWLILVAAVLVPALLISPVVGVAQAASRYIVAESFETLPTNHQFETQSLTIDLSGLPWNGENIELNISGDVGNITVLVPIDVSASGTARVGLGRIHLPSYYTSWPEVDRTVSFDHPGYDEEGPILGHVTVNAQVEVGGISVQHTWVERNPS